MHAALYLVALGVALTASFSVYAAVADATHLATHTPAPTSPPLTAAIARAASPSAAAPAVANLSAPRQLSASAVVGSAPHVLRLDWVPPPLPPPSRLELRLQSVSHCL